MQPIKQGKQMTPKEKVQSARVDVSICMQPSSISEKHTHYKGIQNQTHETIKFALEYLAQALEDGCLSEKFKDECESMISHAEHRKKIASMDYHTSEENHQDGRWHCAYDLSKWADELNPPSEKMLKEFKNA